MFRGLQGPGSNLSCRCSGNWDATIWTKNRMPSSVWRGRGRAQVTPNLDPPRSTRGGPFLLIVCVRSHRCTGFKKRDTTEAALLARAASGLSLVADERGGLISSRTARGVRVNLVLAMVFHRHVRRKAVLFPATRAQAAEAGLMLHKLASSWLRGEASMDSYCLRAG